MTNLTVMTIAGNYPEEIHISAGKNSENNRWYGTVYLMRDEEIHSMLVSHSTNYEGFETEEIAVQNLREICEKCVEFLYPKNEENKD